MSNWYDLSKIFQEMELNLIVSMKKTLKKHTEEEKKQGFRYEQWQSAKLRDLERFRQENKSIIDSFKPEIDRIITQSIVHSYDKGVKIVSDSLVKAEKTVLDKNIDIALPKRIEPVVEPSKLIESETVSAKEVEANLLRLENSERVKEEVFFRMNDDKLKALLNETKKTIAKPTSAILRYQEDEYRRILFKTQVMFNSGSLTLEQAIDKATRDFLEAGISNILYSNGAKVNIADYVAMALRTANHRAFLIGQGAKRQRLGVTTVLVSQHLTACPLCVPWQNMILIDDVFSGGKPTDGPYELVSTAIAQGLFHINCQHNLNTFYPGISTKPPTLDPSKVNEKYILTQKQRQLERSIRKQKRIVAGTLDITNFNKENDKLKLKELKLNEFLENNNLRKRNDKLKIEINKPDIKTHERELLEKAVNTIKSTISKDGVEIQGFKSHFIDRVIERNIKVTDVVDALKTPMKIGNIKYDDLSRPSKEYIGKRVRVQINPETKELITCWKTSNKLRRKYLGDDYEDKR